MLLIQKGEQRFRMKSGIFVPCVYWNEKKQCITIPRKCGSAIEEELLCLRTSLDELEKNIEILLSLFKNKADKIFLEKVLPLMNKISGVVTVEKIQDILQEEEISLINAKMDENEKDFFVLAEKFLKKGLSVGRIRMFRVFLRSMMRYEYYRKNILFDEFSWNIDKVKRKDVEGYYSYLENEYKIISAHPDIFTNTEYNTPNIPKKDERQVGERGNNRLVTMKKGVRTIWYWLIKNGYTDNNPFRYVSVGAEHYGTPFYLTKEERNIIACFDFGENKHLNTQRDIFIFHCLVGCRVGDLSRLTEKNIVNNMLIYTPRKTKDDSVSRLVKVPLSQKALQLIAKYEGIDKKGRLFPFIAEQNYNYAIKDIIKKSGITRKVNVRNSITGEDEMKPIFEVASSHMARRTFIGNSYEVVKDPNIIGKMSGHVEGSKAFSRYRDISDSILKEVINAIE